MYPPLVSFLPASLLHNTGVLTIHMRLMACQLPCSSNATCVAALACSLMITCDMQCHGGNSAIPGGSESETGPHAPIKAGRAGIPCCAPPAHKPR